ncbi:DinI-like family protein [Buttiauxella gaviniae]|uniref:DinI-like family protein n=1 Tax=Buttiauxella gaviniae TaxID=82990 RepID=UPI0039B0B51E
MEKHLLYHFADVRLRVRRGTANGVTVLGGMKTDKELVRRSYSKPGKVQKTGEVKNHL